MQGSLEVRKLDDGRCLSGSLVVGRFVEDVVAPRGGWSRQLICFGRSEEGLDETNVVVLTKGSIDARTP